MDLTPEDDDLLSYFLSADVAAERMPAPPTSAAAADEPFAVSRPAPLPHERAFGEPAQPSGAPAGGAAPISAFQQMQNAFGATESTGPRSTTTDDDNNASGTGADTDEKRQRR